MASITDLSIRRPVATSMAFLILVVVGVVSFRSLPVDLLPKIEFTQLSVVVGYPNVGPEEIEQIITDPLENAVSGLPNLERVTSNSEEGRAWVRLEFGRGTNIDEAANDLRSALDRVRDNLPVEAEAPRIFKFDLDRAEVVSLAATSTRDLEELTRILENEISQRFEQIPGVGAIELRGGVYRQIQVELDRDRLQGAGLTALDVRDALSRENVTLPAGNVKSGLSDLYVRAIGEYTSVEQIGNTVVQRRGNLPIRVQDVAQVRDGYEDVYFLVEVNGVPSISLGLQKQSGANTVGVADAIRAEVERINAERSDLLLTVVSDQSEFIKQSMNSVRTSALWGSLLAVVVLYSFLRNLPSTGIIGLSIPISVVASFGLLYFGGQTLNQMTFGGLALGVGLIVDNSIVVLENIVRKREEDGLGLAEAASVGTREVGGAIIASTLTTCVIFLPVVFTTTTSGALFQALALVVVFALACSLLVALTLVPMLAARLLKVRAAEKRERSRHTRVFRKLERWYTERLRGVLRHRGRVFLVTGILLGGALIMFQQIPVELAPQADADEIGIDLDMARGTNIAVVRSYLAELEDRVRKILPEEDVRLLATEVRGDNASIELKLVPENERSKSASAIAEDIRQALVGQVPGGEIEVEAQQGLWLLRRIFSSGDSGDALQIELRGYDLDQADQLAAEIRGRLLTVPGINGVRLSRREGQPEQRLLLDRERISELGLSVEDVGRNLLANVAGVEAGRFRRGGDEFPIVVRLRAQDRLSGQDLDAVALRTASGDVIPLSAVVTVERGRGPVRIQRVDGQRVTYITANLDSGVALGDAVTASRDSLRGMVMPEGFSYLFGGEYVEQEAARKDFSIAILLALVLVYMLMAAQFERLLDPLVVMTAVPVALIGVVPTLLLTGTTLNVQSIMGLVMLIGIVVNNAIVLVDTINMIRRQADRSVLDAVLEAARLRLRPILMTTATTVLGLLPLAVGIGPGAEIQAALARVVVGGLIASTLVTLFLIPTSYITATSLLQRLRSGGRAEDPSESAVAEEVAPA